MTPPDEQRGAGMASTRHHRPTVEIAGKPLSEGFPVHQVELTVVDGEDAGEQIVSEKAIIRIGADVLCDVVLTDPTVSRNHAELRQRGETLHLVDLESTNGTFVEGERIEEVPLRPDTRFRVGRTTVEFRLRTETVAVETTDETRYDDIIGRSQALREIFSIMDRVAPSELSVVIEGETGSGKELIARAVHDHSQRAESPFVVFDCSAFPADLLESQLFGHTKGAFTGAVRRHRGVFERADGGTVFFDELGELDLEFQAKFLRVLETGEFRPVGSEETRSSDVRVVCATNRDLEERIDEGVFREDLFYRLAQVRFRLPPLRERVEDIPLLVRHFLEEQAERMGTSPRVEREAYEVLESYEWPGNIRELRNVVEKAVAMCPGGLITADYLRDELQRGRARGTRTSREAPSTAGEPAARQRSRGVGQAPGGEGGDATHLRSATRMLRDDDSVIPFKQAKEELIADFERQYLEMLLARCTGNISKAARIAQIDRRHFYRLLEKHDMK